MYHTRSWAARSSRALIGGWVARYGWLAARCNSNNQGERLSNIPNRFMDIDDYV